MGGVNHTPSTAYQAWLASHKPFHWFIAFYGILKNGGFDVIIGNPPYVEYSKVKKEYKVIGYETERCGNLYAFVFERSFRLLQKSGWKSMIIPNSAYCTDRMATFQKLFHRQKEAGWIQTYDTFPAKLFDGVHQRLSIYITQLGTSSSNMLYTSRYHRWYERFRPHLFDIMGYTDLAQISVPNSVPKIGGEIEKNVWRKLARLSIIGQDLAKKRTPHVIYFHNSPLYWLRSMDFVPYFWNERDGKKNSTQVKSLYLTTELEAAINVAILNSSLFYWWFIILSDCRHVNLREIRSFPMGIAEMEETVKHNLSQIVDELMLDLKHHAQRKKRHQKTTGLVLYDEFYPRHSKHIIDKIDRVLAQHYSFTDEELDFIINYDIKYRMGLGN